MADPFSVTGTAVGITSLGIQVCQGLVQYYSQARSYHDDIDAAIQQVEGLEGILKGLSRVGLETSRDGDSSEASEKLETAMRACQSCLRSLEEQLKKCRATKEPERLQDHVKLIRKRLLWPFKKDTIASLQVTLDRMQANVELALHILGVDINNRQFMKVMSSNQAIIERHDILDVKQEHQIATLQRVEDGIEQQTSTMNAHMAYNAMQLSGVLTQLHLLVDRSGRSQNPNQMPPSLLEDTITTFEETQTSYKRDLRKYKKSVKRVQKSSHAQLQACQCRYPAKQSTYWRSWARVLIRSKWQSDHLPDCPHFEHGDFELAVEVDFRNFAHLLHRRISLGIGYSRCRGEFAIFPKIRYKAVVPPDSPGFKPLYDAIEWIRSIKKDGHGEVQGTKQEAERLCEEIQATIMTSFHERTASPVDTLANGETILHVSHRFLSSSCFSHALRVNHIVSDISSLDLVKRMLTHVFE
ncbi:hypothetical protein BDV96DRAFT_179764 [Lophiotrema nucula]|uniref:Fungal N-terminal domain-containing protein n=1 Tax=Lophiotrema nucula TaxID=690887 RepID=A0A6A5YYH4_9PLEO|nr:hypothetical protein BDV96DRAFT_179764 [Lophiotrema nucula]